MKLVIQRSKWRRGRLGGTRRSHSRSLLLAERGNHKCCLGFLAIGCGATPKQIRGKLTPASLPTPLFTKGGLFSNTPFRKLVSRYDNAGLSTLLDNMRCDSLMKTNDSTDITEEEREAKITTGMAKIGVQVTFVD